MTPQEITANIGKRFRIAVPGQRKFIATVLEREPDNRGWKIAYEVSDSNRNRRTKTMVVSPEQIMEVYEPYVLGEEDAEQKHRRINDDESNCHLDQPIDCMLMPTLWSGGFELISPQAVKVWLALLTHALMTPRSHAGHAHDGAVGAADDGRGVPAVENDGPDGFWTVDQLAKAVGKKPRAIHYALDELDQFGWVHREKLRSEGGMVLGFHYRLLPPPKALPNIARTVKEREAKEKFQTALEELRRVKRAK